MADAPNEKAESIKQRVAAVVDAIRPIIQADGGDLELVDVTGEDLDLLELWETALIGSGIFFGPPNMPEDNTTSLGQAGPGNGTISPVSPV